MSSEPHTARPRLLDLFCCEGGAAKGYALAGFEVVGVDINPQPNYPYEFVQCDAIDVDLAGFDAIHASPPCQRFSTSTASSGRPKDWPDLVAPIRQRLEAAGVPYVIENVEGAPLRPDVVLCGSMFGMQVRRHRVFELGGWMVWGAPSCHHAAQRRRGPIVDVTGHSGGRRQTLRDGYPTKWMDVEHGREVMGMPWASARGVVEAIPPAYTEWLGGELIAHLAAARAGSGVSGHQT